MDKEKMIGRAIDIGRDVAPRLLREVRLIKILPAANALLTIQVRAR